MLDYNPSNFKVLLKINERNNYAQAKQPHSLLAAFIFMRMMGCPDCL